MSDEKQQPYHHQHKGDWAEEYDGLVGPDGFECVLTEPEDRTWTRDGLDVVQRLNAQHKKIERLRAALQDVANIIEAAPELNPSNYDHDQVCELNAKMVEACLYLRAALGKEPT